MPTPEDFRVLVAALVSTAPPDNRTAVHRAKEARALADAIIAECSGEGAPEPSTAGSVPSAMLQRELNEAKRSLEEQAVNVTNMSVALETEQAAHAETKSKLAEAERKLAPPEPPDEKPRPPKGK